MDKREYQNKRCYLENCVVREQCKQRTAYIYTVSSMMSFACQSLNIADKSWEACYQLGKHDLFLD